MATVYLIPAQLQDEAMDVLPAYLLPLISGCQVFYVENERTTRRYFKQLWRTHAPGNTITIDAYEWVNMTVDNATAGFRNHLKEDKTIGIVSEAGCPGVADPGQALVAIAQEAGALVKPLVGPSSILLALMASGMNGQSFCFHGYLPIEQAARTKAIRELETDSAKHNRTQLFIETPYRNNQLFEALLNTCKPDTSLCIAADITGSTEFIRTLPVSKWKQAVPALHKRPVMFLLYAAH